MLRIGIRLNVSRTELIGNIIKHLGKIQSLKRRILLRFFLGTLLTEMQILFFVSGDFLNMNGRRIFFADVTYHNVTSFLLRIQQ